MNTNNNHATDNLKKKSLLKVTIHSFFIIPFLVTVFCLLLYGLFHILTNEEHSVYDYLNDVKVGSFTKRWQSAFELSKILANHDLIPSDDRFVNELTVIFEQAKYDDDRVRQYLALAMGRTGNIKFVDPLLAALPGEKESNVPALIHALGLLKSKKSLPAISSYVNDANPKIRLTSVIALGNIGDAGSLPDLKLALGDEEPNVQWDAAIALAKLGDASGRDILEKLLSRDYLAKFPEVDPYEQDQALVVAIEASTLLDDPSLNAMIRNLSRKDRNMNVRRAAMKAIDADTVKQ